MITLFDLREKNSQKEVEAILNFYKEPIKVVRLEKQSIQSCVGCWTCWLKTPGRCVMKDHMSESYVDYVNSETVILLLDVAQGFINYQAKAFLDRTIPHYMPYIEIINGECHHEARYNHYPDMVFYYDVDGLTIQENRVIEDYLCRTAYHFKSKGYRMIMDDKLRLKSLDFRKIKKYAPNLMETEPMGKLIIYNGSPRRNGSNSAKVLNKAVAQMGSKIEIRDLKMQSNWDEWADSFSNEKNVMFFMPLYVHSMPSHVMNFIEKLKVSEGNISFFVQSGFPESSQSYYLEAYFEQLASRLGRKYIGTVIKGGLEGMQIRSVIQQEKIMDPMIKAICELVYKGRFDSIIVRQLAKPIKLGLGVEIVFRLLGLLGLINSFWDRYLNENHAFEKRYDQPYLSLENNEISV